MEHQRVSPDATKAAWDHACKLTKALQKQVNKITDSERPDLNSLHELEERVAQLRLTCAGVIFQDFAFAFQEGIERVLWHAHCMINTAYRKTSSRLDTSTHAVERRKVDAWWAKFLKVSAQFYAGYVQRLAAKFGLKSLLSLAKSLGFDAPQTSSGNDQLSGEVKDMVLGSTYATLVRIGDLTRYQFQVRGKEKFLENAMIYYSLAHDLDFTVGTAHHQMGVTVSLGSSPSRLKFVYHLYMCAVTGTKASMPARNNLSRDFSKILDQKNKGRNAADGDGETDPMTRWFLRLHASLYHGAFKGLFTSRHKELEDEVINRLELAVKSSDPDVGQKLLHMVIINMAAHDFAISTIATSGEKGKSELKRGSMRLNIRFASTFCRLLATELESIEHRFGGNDANGPTTNPATDIILPCLRLYILWLVSYHRELVVAAGNEFHGIFEDLHRNVARAGTSLMTLAQTETDLLKEAAYMLSEDEMALGLLRLSSDTQPFGCRLGYFEGTDTRKPAPKTLPGDHLSHYQETFGRIFDITRGIYFLAAKNHMPIDIESTTDANGMMSLRYTYRSVEQADEEIASPVMPNKMNGQTIAQDVGLPPAATAAAAARSPQKQPASIPRVPQTEQTSWNMSPINQSPPINHQKSPSPPKEPAPPRAMGYDYEDSFTRQVYRPAPVPDRTFQNRTTTPLEPHVEADLLHRLQNYVLPPEVELKMDLKGDKKPVGSPRGFANPASSPTPARAMPAIWGSDSQHGAFPTLPWSYFVNPQPASNVGPALEAPLATQAKSHNGLAGLFTNGHAPTKDGSTATQLFQQYHAERARAQQLADLGSSNSGGNRQYVAFHHSSVLNQQLQDITAPYAPPQHPQSAAVRQPPPVGPQSKDPQDDYTDYTSFVPSAFLTNDPKRAHQTPQRTELNNHEPQTAEIVNETTPVKDSLQSSPCAYDTPFHKIQSYQGTPHHRTSIAQATPPCWNVPSHQEPQAVAASDEPPQLRHKFHDIDRRMHANRSAYDGLILARVREAAINTGPHCI